VIERRPRPGGQIISRECEASAVGWIDSAPRAPGACPLKCAPGFARLATMPKEIGPSSYECDCGYVAQFSEATILALKQRSLMKRPWLSDGGEAGGHIVVFEGGKMMTMLCPKERYNEKPAPCFTRLQGRYLAFIHQYTTLHRVPPAEHEMQRFFQVSPPTVHQMILTLERKGLIKRTPGKARSIKVLVAAEQLERLT